MRHGNAELSAYGNFDTQILDNLSKVDNLSTNLNSGSFQLNNLLQSALADLSNNAIDARSFLNIDPVVLDLNGDGFFRKKTRTAFLGKMSIRLCRISGITTTTPMFPSMLIMTAKLKELAGLMAMMQF
jgi:hypothetical protein